MGKEIAPKPDFKNGYPVSKVLDGALILGQVDGEDIVLTRRGGELFAVGANCTHYGGSLAKGLVVSEEVRCPLHHACFNLRTGEATKAPALDSIACWRVEIVGDTAFVRERLPAPQAKPALRSTDARKIPASVVIVGGGGAGLAAAEMLRREGYDGSLTMISADDAPPYDRPNLSKDYLAGTASEEWLPLRPADFYRDRQIKLVLGSRVSSLDVRQRKVQTENGEAFGFEALLLATGADPVRLKIDGATDSQIHYLRTYADSKAIVAKAASAKRVVVVGASFIGLEVAAALCARGLEVHVAAPEKQPLERVLGGELGGFVRSFLEGHGVVFHLGETVNRVDGRRVTLSGGGTLDADFVVLGVGVRPALTLAESAGLVIDRGVAVNEYLETSAPGIFAAGDIARWPDPSSGDRIRVEHWTVAERQGQVAAKNIVGQRQRYTVVPFFWTHFYDFAIHYIGHAEKWDAVEIDGKLDSDGCAVTYKRGGKVLAVATIKRDLLNLQTEVTMESGAQPN